MLIVYFSFIYCEQFEMIFENMKNVNVYLSAHFH